MIYDFRSKEAISLLFQNRQKCGNTPLQLQLVMIRRRGGRQKSYFDLQSPWELIGVSFLFGFVSLPLLAHTEYELTSKETASREPLESGLWAEAPREDAAAGGGGLGGPVGSKKFS